MNLHRRLVIAATGVAVFAAAVAAIALGSPAAGARVSQTSEQHPDQVLEWNQIFVETLIATNTANSSSQRLGAIVHTAIFDAYNGIERRYTPIFVQNVDGNGERLAPPGASRRAAVIAAAYTALVGLFPSRAAQLGDSYAASLAALSDDGGDGGQSRERGIAWGTARRAGRTRLARGGWLQRELPVIHRRNSGRPVAPDRARHVDERTRVGVHGAVRHREQHAVPARPAASVSRARPTRRTSMQSRRSVAEPDRRAPTPRRSSRRSGRATPASTGIRRQTRSRAPTICRCPTATGSSPS